MSKTYILLFASLMLSACASTVPDLSREPLKPIDTEDKRVSFDDMSALTDEQLNDVLKTANNNVAAVGEVVVPQSIHSSGRGIAGEPYISATGEICRLVKFSDGASASMCGSGTESRFSRTVVSGSVH